MDKNLIIFLIAIAWFIYNSYKKSQKKKQQLAAKRATPSHREAEQSEYYEEEKEDRVSQIFEEILLGGKTNKPKSPYEEPVPEPISQKQVYETKPAFESLELPIEEIKKSRISERKENQDIKFRSGRSFKSNLIEEKEILGGQLFEGDEFDLRKAVIYSEVLNRPYS